MISFRADVSNRKRRIPRDLQLNAQVIFQSHGNTEIEIDAGYGRQRPCPCASRKAKGKGRIVYFSESARDLYKPLLDTKPAAVIGYSIYVYWVDRPWWQ